LQSSVRTLKVNIVIVLYIVFSIVVNSLWCHGTTL